MPQLLVITSLFVLRYCTERRQTFILESERPGYYGASWFTGEDQLYLSHSGLTVEDLHTTEDYMLSEVGYLSRGANTSPPFLSAPHQIRCLDDGVVAATNTGRNCLSLVNTRDWSVRQIRFNDVLWDRMGSADKSGNHFNSIEYKPGRLFIVAHNFDKGSFAVELEWPSLKSIDTKHYDTSGIHNLWIRDDGMWLSCDTMHHGLIDLRTQKVLWQADGRSLTRGLAATTAHIYVGSSDYGSRELRNRSETGVWVLDAGTMQTRDYHWLGHFGGVHEIRVMDELDSCHPAGPLPYSITHSGISVADYWRGKRIDSSRLRAELNRNWKLELGNVELLSSGTLSLAGQSLQLAYRQDIAADSEITVSATLKVRERSASIAGIIGEYLGPADENMIAVLLAGSTDGQINLGVWSNEDGQWNCLFVKPYRKQTADVSLVVGKEHLVVRLENAELFTTSRKGKRGNRVGIRGNNGEISNFSVSRD